MSAKLWMQDRLEELKEDAEFQLEEFKVSVIEDICRLMKFQNISRKNLAERLNCSQAYVTKVLRGSENLTLTKLFQIAKALECKPSVSIIPKNYYSLVYIEDVESNKTEFAFSPEKYGKASQINDYTEVLSLYKSA